MSRFSIGSAYNSLEPDAFEVRLRRDQSVLLTKSDPLGSSRFRGTRTIEPSWLAQRALVTRLRKLPRHLGQCRSLRYRLRATKPFAFTSGRSSIVFLPQFATGTASFSRAARDRLRPPLAKDIRGREPRNRVSSERFGIGTIADGENYRRLGLVGKLFRLPSQSVRKWESFPHPFAILLFNQVATRISKISLLCWAL